MTNQEEAEALRESEDAPKKWHVTAGACKSIKTTVVALWRHALTWRRASPKSHAIVFGRATGLIAEARPASEGNAHACLL
jgi:hypothetical protein